ncbi:MAG: phosphatidylinositol transfer protein, partial [Polyangiaceae bacterium]|nr:phosphatidylinositol transfer protein [Polyangiaceae bacterium]
DDIFGNGPNDPVEGVNDDGGRVYFKIPPEKELGLGRHRVRLVVRGDLSGTDVYIEVVPKGTPIFVTDIDGTLTESEYIEFSALLQGELPPVHADAAKAFSILVSKGYRPMYLTARPEWLGQRTRDVLAANNFPPGIVHTTVTDTGAVGGSAVDYKTGELAMLKARDLVPSLGFGNAESDAEAYDNGQIQPVGDRIFYQFDDVAFGGRRIESYTQLLEEFEARPDAVCP